ncbi:MAG: hypothetical protein H0U67_00900, partial [Gemmatimonadetes bacterium]|nr:hypothetical protein [Gemmatimonadota bacterium]
MASQASLFLREREREPSGSLLARALPLALGVILVTSAPSVAQQQVPPCLYPPPSTLDPGTFEHRWAGLAYSITTLDGDEVWVGEDGGRIRHRDPSTTPPTWSFKEVPFEVMGIIRKIHFLEGQQQHGWAVSNDGWVLRSYDSGDTWVNLTRMSGSYDLSEWQDLYSIWMYDQFDGILLGTRGIWYTENGGACWEPAVLHYGNNQTGSHYSKSTFQDEQVLFWGLGVQVGPDQAVCGESVESDFLGLVAAKPGYILRSVDWGRTWVTIFKAQIDLQSAVTCGCLYEAMPQNPPLPDPPFFELWDVAISNHETDDLALVVGGAGTTCGLILASYDQGCTWEMELHECDPDPCSTIPGPCAGDPLYEPDLPLPNPPPDYRHQALKVLYGVDIYDDTNIALAVGYNGQQLRREMTTDNPPVPIWRDRSEFGDISDAPLDVIIYPLTRVSVAQGTDKAWLSGFGGHVRKSVDAGDSWSHVLLGYPFRTRAAFLETVFGFEERGWIVGQNYRLMWTEDGGASWDTADPPPVTATCSLFDVTFAGENGVTVGCPKGTSGRGPKILYTVDFATTSWDEPALSSITYLSNESHYLAHGHLRRVAWAGGSSDEGFWTAGKDGLILHTTDGGVTWDQVEIPSSTLATPFGFDIQSVA